MLCMYHLCKTMNMNHVLLCELGDLSNELPRRVDVLNNSFDGTFSAQPTPKFCTNPRSQRPVPQKVYQNRILNSRFPYFDLCSFDLCNKPSPALSRTFKDRLLVKCAFERRGCTGSRSARCGRRGRSDANTSPYLSLL